MVNKILIVGLIALFIFGMTFMANASQTPRLDDRDIVCATLSYNAGYVEEGHKFAARVDPFWEIQQDYIRYISTEVVKELAEHAAQKEDGTLAESSQYFYRNVCSEA